MSELAKRYAQRTGAISELPSYDEVRADPTEGQIERLADVADVLINTQLCTDRDVLDRVAARLFLYGGSVTPLVDVLVGGQYGSEGKGNIAAYLAPEYHVLVRVGGPANAGHTVYAEPENEVFHHLPSGTHRAPNATLVLGPGSVLRVPSLFEEVLTHGVEAARLRIDPQAMVIEDTDIEGEGVLKESIGSTGQGVGRATARKALRTAATPAVRLARDVPELEPFIFPAVELHEDAYAHKRSILLEGTQGSLLSLHHGSYPHVTSRDTNIGGCLADAGVSRCSRVAELCSCAAATPFAYRARRAKRQAPWAVRSLGQS